MFRQSRAHTIKIRPLNTEPFGWEVTGSKRDVEILARGTRDLDVKPGSAMVEHQLGTAWFYSLRMENLGRNLATVGGIATAYRLGQLNPTKKEID